MRINEGEHKETRFIPFADDEAFRFIDITKGPVWIGDQWIRKGEMSYDGGKSWVDEEKGYVMFGAYFFLSEDIV